MLDAQTVHAILAEVIPTLRHRIERLEIDHDSIFIVFPIGRKQRDGLELTIDADHINQIPLSHPKFFALLANSIDAALCHRGCLELVYGRTQHLDTNKVTNFIDVYDIIQATHYNREPQ